MLQLPIIPHYVNFRRGENPRHYWPKRTSAFRARQRPTKVLESGQITLDRWGAKHTIRLFRWPGGEFRAAVHQRSRRSVPTSPRARCGHVHALPPINRSQRLGYSAFSGLTPAFSSRRVMRPSKSRMLRLAQRLLHGIVLALVFSLHGVEAAVHLRLHEINAAVQGVF